MLILILFAFIAGFVTILSPCILPVLPIILSGSLTGGKKRPIGIVTGFIASFTFFTLLLSSLVKSTGISADSLRLVSVVAIGFFGISLLIPKTQELLELLFSKLSAFIPRSNTEAGFGSGLILGACLGLIWTPCVGPILASVITLALSGSTNFSAFLITLAYSFGTGIPMLAITVGGRQLLQKVPWLLANTAKIQKGFGVVMIAMAVLIFYNIDRKIQTIILTTFPQYGAGLTSIEDNAIVRKQLDKLRGGKGMDPSVNLPTAQGTLPDRGLAPNPNFDGASKWLNSEPLSLETNLKGKVVLVDFWTYSCINCIRTFPYLRDWYSKYKDQGFEIVGVHSPEFEFEKEEVNVRSAMEDFQLTYPVVMDNDFRIWNSYQNQYWPAHYLIDANGHIRYVHFGEGRYTETEENIKTLLEEAGKTVADSPSLPEAETRSILPQRLSPETYLGWGRADAYTDSMAPSLSEGIDRSAQYKFQEPLAENEVGLRGQWKVEKERITSGSNSSTLSMKFRATNVFLVMSGTNPDNIPVTVKLDGNEMNSETITQDFNMSGGISVTKDRKYDIVSIHGPVQWHTLELTIPTGISAYAFTFGE